MNKTIGPYKIMQRTPYSKIRCINIDNGEDITLSHKKIFNKILHDYEMQKKFKNDYFEIKGTRLIQARDPSSNKDLEYLFIPEDITIIEPYALQGIHARYISLPSTLLEIGEYAFLSCHNLERLDIPRMVRKIDIGAFKACCSLNKVNLSNISVLEKSSFAYCSELKNINLPDSIEKIGDHVFYECSSLRNVIFSKKLKEIGVGAFGECYALKNFNLPESLEVIGESAFSGCQALKEINLPDNIQTIYAGAFTGCHELKRIKLPNCIEELNKRMFSMCTNIEAIEIPDSVKILGNLGLSATESIESINVPKDLKVIDSEPFQFTSIKSLKFNYDLVDLDVSGDASLLKGSCIEKIVINGSVKKITPKAIGSYGAKIEQIEFIGTKEQLEEFKNNNKPFFALLPNLKDAICLEDMGKVIGIESINR